MYLRHTTVRKDGKTHSYWRLVRSVRRGRKVVQETVAQSLTRRDARGLGAWRCGLRDGASSMSCSRRLRGGANRLPCDWTRSAWNGRAVLAMCGWHGVY